MRRSPTDVGADVVAGAVTAMPTPASSTAAATHVHSRRPATGEVWRRHPIAGTPEVLGAVSAARAAQPAWAARSPDERASVLERFRRVLYARRMEVARCIADETGKPMIEALGAEVMVALDYARFYAREAPRELAGSWARPSSVAMWRKRVRIVHEPYGVIGVISPWNYPFMLAAGVVLPALAAGNAVVLKPSELTPTSGVLLGELLEEAGIPDGVMHVLPGAGETGAALTAADVDKISFTGSVPTGRRVAVACAERLVPCSLELGGSDPAIVLEDADVAVTARGIAWARFTNAGQTCVAPKRVIAAGASYEPLLAALATQVSALRVGTGASSDVGPLVHASQVATLRGQLDDALARGARVVAQAPMPDAGPAFFAPTLLADVTPDMRVMREETFGPLLPVIAVRDEDAAVALANASEFGLSASVWTRDRARALAVAERLEAGTVAINDAAIVAGIAEVPHGGVKSSGLGRAHGVAGLLEYTRTKAVVDERLPGMRQAWWFGYGPAIEAAIDAAIRVSHGPSWRARLGSVTRTLPLLRR